MTDSQYSLVGRKALVCGSTQGIGHACAVAMARQGAEVTVMARNEEGLRKVQGELPADHGQSHGCLVADFTDWEQVRARAREYIGESGPVHILLNNTGGPPAGPLLEAEPENLVKAFGQHILCNEVLAQAMAPGMRDEGYGRIINIISSSVVIPIKGLGISNVTRGAVANWARTLAGELGQYGITVNNILPGYVATTRLDSLIGKWSERDGISTDEVRQRLMTSIPLGRLAAPEEVGSVAAFLASPAASYVNGVNMPVDGGRLARQ
jgi:3-oxoacyl-[acyl-carrier protein] reductase